MAIYDHLSNYKNFRKYSGEIGLEIETETKQRYNIPDFYFWNSHGDGSLRDYGIEYVLKQPVSFKKELPDALKEWGDKTKSIKFIKDSISTSVHVHLNMMPESFRTLGNFLTTYVLVENLLIRYSGPDRISNLFCLPVCDAEDMIFLLENMFKHISSKMYKSMIINEQTAKYAACNIAALGAYGSIEIRSFRGETSTEKIEKWVEILYNILEFARTNTNPKQILELWRKNELEILDIVFKNNKKEIFRKDARELIAKNTWYAAMIAYAVKDWETLDVEEKVATFKPTEKQMNDCSLKHFNVLFDNLSDADKGHVLYLLEKDFLTKKKSLKMPELVLRPNPIPVEDEPVRFRDR